MSSPTEQAITAIKKAGGQHGITEKWNHHIKKRQDLWGFVDLLAMIPRGGVMRLVAIQVTTRSNMNARVEKIREKCRDKALAFLATGNAIEVWGTDKFQGKNRLTIIQMLESDF